MRRPSRSTLFPYTTLFPIFPESDPMHREIELLAALRWAEIFHVEGTFAANAGNVQDWLEDRAPDFVAAVVRPAEITPADRKSTRLNSSHGYISYAVFCLKKK